MTLQDRLDEMKAKSRDRLPPEILSAMKSNMDQLKASGRRDEALGVGARIPAFNLADGYGRHYDNIGLLTKGPLVINFFRGFW